MSETINESTMSRSQKDVFKYYLLKDYDLTFPRTVANGDAAMEGDEEVAGVTSRAEQFAAVRCLPRPWVVFAEAYWALDNEDWEVGCFAIQYVLYSCLGSSKSLDGPHHFRYQLLS
jgi:hypothetical protein